MDLKSEFSNHYNVALIIFLILFSSISTSNLNINNMQLESESTYGIKYNHSLGEVINKITKAKENTVLFINTGNELDNKAIGYIYGNCSNNQIEIYYNNSAYIHNNQRPMLDENPDIEIIVLVGGPFANPVVQHFDKSDYSWISYNSNMTYHLFKERKSEIYPVKKETYGDITDYFVLQTYEVKGVTIISVWGITASGTVAGAQYLLDTFRTDLNRLSYFWRIYYWSDLNDDKYPDDKEIKTHKSSSSVTIEISDQKNSWEKLYDYIVAIDPLLSVIAIMGGILFYFYRRHLKKKKEISDIFYKPLKHEVNKILDGVKHSDKVQLNSYNNVIKTNDSILMKISDSFKTDLKQLLDRVSIYNNSLDNVRSICVLKIKNALKIRNTRLYTKFVNVDRLSENLVRFVLNKNYVNSVIIDELKEILKNLPEKEKFETTNWKEYVDYWIKFCEEHVKELIELQELRTEINAIGDRILKQLNKKIID